MSVVTISLYWGFLPEEAWATEKKAVHRDGKINNSNLAYVWNVKMCGFQNSERAKLMGMLDDEEYEDANDEHNTVSWIIRRQQYDARSKRLDENQASINDKNNPPMEFITKYLAKLSSMGYTVVSAPSVVDVEVTTVWTLSKPKKTH